ncbi:phage portal protein [Rhizobium sp. LjRoot30]|uniref:phage portal protein n=1 Tax=Rhizobium sp. LjRoot30 TaxID=3342320 RepID=UPI003ECC9B9C
MLKRLRDWLSSRSYLAAGGGRRGASMQTMPAPLISAYTARGPIAARARFAVGNNPMAQGAVQAWAAQAIGAGIKASSQHPDKPVREALNSRFTAWTDEADDEGRTDWFGLQTALFRSMVTAGEGLALMLSTKAGLRIRILDPEQLDASYSATLANGVRIVQGVEFNADGQRVAYHIFSHAIGTETALTRERKRIPAEDVLHLYRQDWPGQVRGLSWFAPVLVRLADLDGWRDAQIMRQRVAAMLAGFVVTTDGSGAPFDGTQQGTNLVGGLEPGAIKFLDPGQDIRFSEPAKIGAEVVDFAVTCERDVATGLGLPAHAFGDVTRANYSSLKQATTAFKARVEQVQWSTFIPQVCVPVWRRWATIEVLSGSIGTTVTESFPVKHTCPRWPSLEPVKDVTADNMELAAGLTTRRALLAARGEDIEQVDAELAADNKRAAELGLNFSTTPKPVNDNEPVEQAA